jgi:hypothetical protein
MKFHHLLFLVLVASLTLLVSCKKDDNPVAPVTPATTTLLGSLAGNASGVPQSGTITLTFPNAKRSATAGDTSLVSGYLYMSTGDTVLLSGYYVKTTGYLYVSGGGYVIQGTLEGGHLSASYTGPGGANGSVVAGSSGSGHTIVTYCGTYQATSGGSNSGTFNMVVDGTSATVITSEGNQFYGTLIDGVVTIYVSGTSGTVLASGSSNGSHASGTYSTGDVSGTWVADVCH